MKHRIRQQNQPGTDGLIDPLATLADGRDIASHMGLTQLLLVGVDKALFSVLVDHQHPATSMPSSRLAASCPRPQAVMKQTATLLSASHIQRRSPPR